MNEIRRSAERGHADHGWLDSFHSFSFADYQDPRHMGFGSLRVINEDRIQPGTGSSIVPGDVQRMSAGTGVMHSEFNHATGAATHFLQIWIEPAKRGIPPSYEQKRFESADKRGRLRLIASSDGRDGSVTVHQDASVYAALLDGEERATHRLASGRRAYVHVARGSLAVNGHALGAGDALKTDAVEIVLEKGEGAEVLLFDLA